jgi:Cytochrome P450
MTFNPERWLENKDLVKYQVAFSKGRRSCLGQKYVNSVCVIYSLSTTFLNYLIFSSIFTHDTFRSLAYAELRLFLATLFRRFDMELFETSIRNARVVEDYFIGCAVADSKGIRVRVTGLRK